EHVRPDQSAEHDYQSGRHQERLDGAVRNDDPQLVRRLSFLRVDARALVIRFLAFPERIASGHGRNLGEVVLGRRTGNAPLQSAGSPRIRAGNLTAPPTLEAVVDEEQ